MKTTLYLALLILTTTLTYGQCDALIKITQQEFEQHFVQGDTVQPSAGFVKEDNEVHIPGIDHPYTDWYEDGVMVYEPVGKIFNDFYVLEMMDEIKDSYYLIRPEPYSFTEVTGYPYMYGNYILAIESPHTDYDNSLEVWEFKNGTFKLCKKIGLTACGIQDVLQSYIKNKTAYIKTYYSQQPQYYKLKF
ncbi:hypothetical protein [Flavobacterium rhizosphaerae]|uniref:Uncharacterized protein n=1 Tax=Flavobacterium rhizosphaerae TaxID=3163298 RepID=A0ABW8YX41_9FLAO